MIPVLTTERLILRPHRAEDLDAVAAMTGDAEVMRYIGGVPQPREDSWRRMLCGPAMWMLLGYGYWIVERRADGAVIGQLGFADFKRAMEPSIEGIPELGYVFAAHAHGQGYASEGVAAALRWADSALAADQHVAIIDPENAASIRVIEKAGFAIREPALYKDEPILLFRRTRPAL
ncbi:MAG: GNAT family N-acetyltransferase [Allosphingosinicella sp.]|uniref:GNAT family N-acetyltransferase n=1 Tax=Allosphingosinicella sp. TaxID=2823234 RepID=UPI003925E07A